MNWPDIGVAVLMALCWGLVFLNLSARADAREARRLRRLRDLESKK